MYQLRKNNFKNPATIDCGKPATALVRTETGEDTPQAVTSWLPDCSLSDTAICLVRGEVTEERWIPNSSATLLL